MFGLLRSRSIKQRSLSRFFSSNSGGNIPFPQGSPVAPPPPAAAVSHAPFPPRYAFWNFGKSSAHGDGPQFHKKERFTRVKNLLFKMLPFMAIGALLYYLRKTQQEASIEDDYDLDDENLKKMESKDPTFSRMRYQIKMDRVNDKILDYKGAVMEATNGTAIARQYKKRQALARKFGCCLDDLTVDQVTELVKLERKYRADMKSLRDQETSRMNKMRNEIWELFLDDDMDPDDSEEHVKTVEIKESSAMGRQLDSIQKTKRTLELVYFFEILNVLTPDQRQSLLRVFGGGEYVPDEDSDLPPINSPLDEATSEQLDMFSLFVAPNTVDMLAKALNNPVDILQNVGTLLRPHVFVLSFIGDEGASQVERLREEVTAVLAGANKERGDSVVVVLDSPGGTVTGYGLAAAQLNRIKEAGFKLTVCVDEVAASGGYLMASVAHNIVASPFAMLGSIGVIATIPNFFPRMEREGVSMEEVTAGRYKRTLTPYKKPTSGDRSKMQEDINVVFEMFKGHLHHHRPHLNVNKVATGEVWQGPDALKMGLCDSIATSDEVMLKLVEAGCEVYTVSLRARRNIFPGLFGVEDMETKVNSWLDYGLQLLWRRAALAMDRSVASGSNATGNEYDPRRRYMAIGDQNPPTFK